MIRHIIGVDPATKTGVAYNAQPDWGACLNQPMPWPTPECLTLVAKPAEAKAGKPAFRGKAPSGKSQGRAPRPAVPAIAAEPDYFRSGKIFELVNELILNLICPPPGQYAALPSEIVVISETSAHFDVSKRNAVVASEIRGAIKAACYVQGVFYTEITSDRLNAWVLGGKPRKLYADREKQRQHVKELKINAARIRYGYKGSDNDIADALHIFAYGWANAKIYERRDIPNLFS